MILHRTDDMLERPAGCKILTPVSNFCVNLINLVQFSYIHAYLKTTYDWENKYPDFDLRSSVIFLVISLS